MNIDTQEMFKALDGLGLNLGPLFSNMPRARFSDDKCVAKNPFSNSIAAMPAQFEFLFVMNRATLNGCIQPVVPNCA